MSKRKLHQLQYDPSIEFTRKNDKQMSDFLYSLLIKDVFNNQMQPVLLLIIQYHGNFEEIIKKAKWLFDNVQQHYYKTHSSYMLTLRQISYSINFNPFRLDVVLNWYNSRFYVDAYGNIGIGEKNYLSSIFSMTPTYELENHCFDSMDTAYIVRIQENKEQNVLITKRVFVEDTSKYNILKTKEKIIGNVLDQVIHFPDSYFERNTFPGYKVLGHYGSVLFLL